MRTPLAWHNLVHKKVKTVLAVAGIAFAVVLMFMQLGFLEAVKASATMIYDTLDFDLCIRSKDYLHLAESRTFPRERLHQARNVAAVTQAAVLLVTNSSWRNPQTGEKRSVLSFGVDPRDKVFRTAETQARVSSQLRGPLALLIDTMTRPEFGPLDGFRFGPRDAEHQVEINGQLARIAGFYTCGAGLSSGGAMIMDESELRKLSPRFTAYDVSLGLVQLVRGAEPDQVASLLRRTLPDDVDILTRDDVLRGELLYWVWETNYGLLFQTGVVMALIVGVAIVYQVLASDVASLLKEYATLKAIGYSNRYLAGIVLQQALVLAVAGFLVGLAISLGLYAITAAGARIPIRMTAPNFFLVLGLAVSMCLGSGLAALRKAFSADPAELF